MKRKDKSVLSLPELRFSDLSDTGREMAGRISVSLGRVSVSRLLDHTFRGTESSGSGKSLVAFVAVGGEDSPEGGIHKVGRWRESMRIDSKPMKSPL